MCGACPDTEKLCSSSLGVNIGLVTLDQEKALDHVKHRFLCMIMQRFGFSTGFIARIQVLDSNIESVPKIKGGLCVPLRVYRGVRQGFAPSGMLSALSPEPLLHKLRFAVCFYRVFQKVRFYLLMLTILRFLSETAGCSCAD